MKFTEITEKKILVSKAKLERKFSVSALNFQTKIKFIDPKSQN